MDGIQPGVREGIVKGDPNKGIAALLPFLLWFERNSEKSEKEEEIA